MIFKEEKRILIQNRFNYLPMTAHRPPVIAPLTLCNSRFVVGSASFRVKRCMYCFFLSSRVKTTRSFQTRIVLTRSDIGSRTDSCRSVGPVPVDRRDC